MVQLAEVLDAGFDTGGDTVLVSDVAGEGLGDAACFLDQLTSFRQAFLLQVDTKD